MGTSSVIRTSSTERRIKEVARFVIQPESRIIEMHFYLNPKNDKSGIDKSTPLERWPSLINLICFRGFKGALSYLPVPETSTMRLDIQFSLSFLESATGPVTQLTRDGRHSITPQMRMIINELLACNRSGALKRLFWQSKVLELFMLQIEEVESAKSRLKSIKDYDVEKLQEARVIVENDLTMPYSLKALAHKVGLNDFKLKRGFKELFGYTVFGYLHELRMLEAKRLLLIEKDTVTDVSGEVGYQHPHHFSAAFKKRFGILPGSLNK